LLPITKQLQDIALQTPGPACQLLAQAIGLTQYTFSYLRVVASMSHTRRSGAMQNLQMHFSPFCKFQGLTDKGSGLILIWFALQQHQRY